MSENYNSQPYDKEYRDTIGSRNITWFNNTIAPLANNIISEKLSFVLDVGCGNGRFFPFLQQISENVVGIDAIEAPNQIYCNHQTVSYISKLHNFEYDNQFDAMFFFGSFLIIKLSWEHKISMRQTCINLLKPDGLIFGYVDIGHSDLVKNEFPDSTIIDIGDKRTKVFYEQF